MNRKCECGATEVNTKQRVIHLERGWGDTETGAVEVFDVMDSEPVEYKKFQSVTCADCGQDRTNDFT